MIKDDDKQEELILHRLETRKASSNTGNAFLKFSRKLESRIFNKPSRTTRRKIISFKRAQRRTPRKGEIVLLNESHIPRRMWKLLRIKDIKTDKGGEVRNVQVETPTGKLLDRPINILYRS
uniref:DUF5641 domain-containing protein n=1 Tax=Brugia malayi TaxID=6279 RepID=A8PDR0_BRUMA